MFHAFLGEKLPDWKSTAKLVRKIAENYKLPYYTISPTYSICRTHGYIEGDHYTCPDLRELQAEVSPVFTGYYRPVQNWNDGKRAEFRDRNLYNIDNAINADMSGHGHTRTAKAESTAKAPAGGEVLLFTTKTCPNCAVAKRMLAEAEIGYKTVDAEENARARRAVRRDAGADAGLSSGQTASPNTPTPQTSANTPRASRNKRNKSRRR